MPAGARVVRHPRRTRSTAASSGVTVFWAEGSNRKWASSRASAGSHSGGPNESAGVRAPDHGHALMMGYADREVPRLSACARGQVSAVNTKPVASFHAMKRGTSATARSRCSGLSGSKLRLSQDT
jgi:hypothetical protein